jgi:head-tail adaptor
MRTAGKMRARLKFQRRANSDDGYGNEDGAWFDLTPPVVRWCDLKPTRGGETIQSARLTGSAAWDCWVRADSGTRGIQPGDRAVDVRDENRTFNVRFNEDMDGKNAWRLIQIESGVADG